MSKFLWLFANVKLFIFFSKWFHFPNFFSCTQLHYTYAAHFFAKHTHTHTHARNFSSINFDFYKYCSMWRVNHSLNFKPLNIVYHMQKIKAALLCCCCFHFLNFFFLPAFYPFKFTWDQNYYSMKWRAVATRHHTD